jgi:hypothetical protein
MTSKAAFLQADVARALRAASKIPGRWSVMIDPNGAIHIIPAGDAPAPPLRPKGNDKGKDVLLRTPW